jgi:hypothetical protein
MARQPKSLGGKSSSLIREGISNDITQSELQLSSAPNFTISTEAGTIIEGRDEQPSNAPSQISTSLDFDSNVICASETQRLKQDSGIRSTCAGMQIDGNDEQWANAMLPSSVSLEPDSKVNCERYEH